MNYACTYIRSCSKECYDNSLMNNIVYFIIKVHEYCFVATYMNDYNFGTEWGMNVT